MTRDLRQRFIVVAFSLYFVFVIYGSLVPLDFRPLPIEEAVASFRTIEYLKLGIVSRADWVSNILLFIPLAFFAMGVLDRRGMTTRLVCSVAVMLALVALSGAIEFTQLFFPPRTVSINDIIAETTGAAVGVAAWWIWRQRFFAWLGGWQRAHGHTDVATRLLWGYLAILFGYSLLPLDLTISPVEIFHKWREGRMVLIPFAFLSSLDARVLYEVVSDVVVWVPISLLIVASGRKNPRSAWMWAVVAASLLELLQVFVWTRVSDVNDVLAAIAGGWVGSWFGSRLFHKGEAANAVPPGRESNQLSLVWGVGVVIWSAVLVAVFWYPYDFIVDKTFLRERLALLLGRVPFHAYYYGTEYRAITELLHRMVFFAPLGALVAAWLKRGRRSGVMDFVLCLIPCGIVAFLIEGGRLLIPSKHPDSIDPALEIAGALAGFWIARAVMGRHTVQHDTDEGNFSGGVAVPCAEPIVRRSRSGVSISTATGQLTRGQLAALCGVPLMFCLAGSVAMSFSGVPYNVRKLFGEGHPVLTLFLLCLALYWVCGVPVWFRVWLAQGSWLRVPAYVVLVMIHGGVCYTLLRLSVPEEMIHKIVGSPVLGWPWEWELIGRFLALFAIPSVLMTGALLPVPLGAGIVRDIHWRWLAGAAFLLPLAHWVVVVKADTDNLVELMAGGGTWFSSLLLGGWLYTMFQTGTVLAARVAGHWRVSLAATLVFVGLSIPLCYSLLWVGTENDIYKYEKRFSAMQFMLSPDREHYLGGMSLALRYGVVHFLAIGVVCATQLTAMKLLELLEEKKTSTRSLRLRERA